MQRSGKQLGLVIVGAVAAVTLGVIAVASAATTATPSPSSSEQANGSNGQAQAPGFDGDKAHGDFGGGLHSGGPDMAEALAKLSGKDVGTILQQRQAGKSYADIAKAYGVDTTKLVDAAGAIEKTEIDAAVKAGSMTDAQRVQALSGLQARFEQELVETGTMGHVGPGGGHGHGFGGGGPDMAQALAQLSGKDESTIMSQIAAGKTFAQLAKTYGVSTDDLLAKATVIEKAELDAAVKAVTLTDAQRTQILSGLQARLTAELTETHALGDHGHGFGRNDGTQTPGAAASPSTSGAALTY